MRVYNGTEMSEVVSEVGERNMAPLTRPLPVGMTPDAGRQDNIRCKLAFKQPDAISGVPPSII
jgi:hypothetical protein